MANHSNNNQQDAWTVITSLLSGVVVTNLATP